jgi:L-ribulose-5-phosphate 3-epimerase
MKRRQFLCTSAAALLGAECGLASVSADWLLRIGVTDWDLLGIHYFKHSTPKPEAVELAKRLGFDGLEINLGRRPDGLPLSDPELQQQFLDQSRRHELPISSTCLDILHQNYLKSDPLAIRWVRQSIPITRRLGARIVLLPFFGQGAIRGREEMDRVADILRDIAPEAAEAGVVLAIENLLSARDNAYLLDRIGSPAVRIYYDVGNSASQGHRVLEEIRWLGAPRICQFHLKDNPHYLGAGDLDFQAIFAAIADIGFHGWGVLETASPSGDVQADMQRNLQFIRQTMQQQADRR